MVLMCLYGSFTKGTCHDALSPQSMPVLLVFQFAFWFLFLAILHSIVALQEEEFNIL